jgi:hypothetical protein
VPSSSSGTNFSPQTLPPEPRQPLISNKAPAKAQYCFESGSYYRSKRYQAEITFDSEPHKPDKDSRYEKPLRMAFHS